MLKATREGVESMIPLSHKVWNTYGIDDYLAIIEWPSPNGHRAV